MLVLYDFQDMFKNVDVGGFESGCSVSVRDNPHTQGQVQKVEDVKTLHLSKRAQRESGVYIHLPQIEGVRAGDRITVTGRIGEGAPSGANWSVVLLIPNGAQIAQHIAPNPVFSLSHILEEDELDKTLIVHTVGWGLVQPVMDFYIDGLLITRNDKVQDDNVDIRTIVYSMSEDPGLQWTSDSDGSFNNTAMILRSGNPTVRIFKRGKANAVHVSVRVNDFDGIDINLKRMELRLGNQYKITVKGRIDGSPPESASIMLQGLPAYFWTNNTPITKDMEFTLEHTLKQSEVEKWTSIRIATNVPGASVSFYIYSIDIVKI